MSTIVIDGVDKPTQTIMLIGADGEAVDSTQQGAIADAAYTDATGAASGTVIALLKGIYVQLAAINENTATP
jgi:hypothetical protein